MSNQILTQVVTLDGLTLTTNGAVDILKNNDGFVIRIPSQLQYNVVVPETQPMVYENSCFRLSESQRLAFERIINEPVVVNSLSQKVENPKPISGGGVKRKYTPTTIAAGGSVKRNYNTEYQRRYRAARREELNEKARERYHRHKRARTQTPSESVETVAI